jgi:translation initiation factor 2 subunit 3
MDVLIETIEKIIPTPKRDPKANPLMYVARSFDINKPGSSPEKIVGGILGGALKQGVLKVGQEIEIKPGLKIEEKNQQRWIPIKTVITGLKTGGKNVDQVKPGGSIGVMTSLDPVVVKSDSLAGSVVGELGKLPPVFKELTLEVKLLERVVGAEEDLKVDPIKMNEPLMLNVNSAATVGVVDELKKDKVKCILKLPVCADKGSKVTISRMVGTRFRLIGYGIITA